MAQEQARRVVSVTDGGARSARDALAVSVRGVAVRFDAGGAVVRALRGADIDVADGEFVAVVGPSGCGKSTLLRVIAGLIVPDDGEVIVAGNALGQLDEDSLAVMRQRHIGMVFQFFNLLEGMNALENVAVAAMIAGARRREAERTARDLLDLLGLPDQARAMPPSLSGGQRQRLAIARALANRPSVLLADEPTGALDSDGVTEILELFDRLHRSGQTIIVVTHDPVVAGRARRVVTMRDGRTSARAD